MSSRLEPLGIRSRVPARQDTRAEGPDVVAARDAVPLTIQQSAGRAGQANRGGAVDHQLVVSEQVNPGRWMQRDRVGAQVVTAPTIRIFLPAWPWGPTGVNV